MTDADASCASSPQRTAWRPSTGTGATSTCRCAPRLSSPCCARWTSTRARRTRAAQRSTICAPHAGGACCRPASSCARTSTRTRGRARHRRRIRRRLADPRGRQLPLQPAPAGQPHAADRAGRAVDRRGDVRDPASCLPAITACTRTAPASSTRPPLIVTPAWLGLPGRLGDRKVWGLATQLYSVRSHGSWGVGDLTDLADLAVWAGDGARRGVRPGQPAARSRAGRADAALAVPADLTPVRESALPAHRARRPSTHRSTSPPDGRCGAMRSDVATGELIDRDSAWTAKRAALQTHLPAANDRPGASWPIARSAAAREPPSTTSPHGAR